MVKLIRIFPLWRRCVQKKTASPKTGDAAHDIESRPTRGTTFWPEPEQERLQEQLAEPDLGEPVC